MAILGRTRWSRFSNIARRGRSRHSASTACTLNNTNFQPVLDGLVDAGRISTPQLTEVPIYDGRSAEHANDTAFVMTFTIS